MFEHRDTHKQVAQHHDGISLVVTHDQGQIGFMPLAAQPPEPTNVVTPVEETNEEPEGRDGDE